VRTTGLVALTAVVTFAVLGGWVSRLDPAAQELALRLTGPSWAHPMGLDELGRDIVSRVLAGARVSLLVALVVVGVSAVVGSVLGAIAGYCGGAVDAVIGRVIDVLLAFPGLLLAIALVAVVGPGLFNVIAALAAIGWVSYARLVRGLVLRVREFDYVLASRAAGAGPLHVLRRHVAPAVLPAVVVQATLGLGGAMLSEASLSFLGLGVQPPAVSWGSMISGGRAHILDAPHLTIFPGLVMVLVVIGLHELGEAVREQVSRQSATSRAEDDGMLSERARPA
jgi:peptide/nickel transport system permease protein